MSRAASPALIHLGSAVLCGLLAMAATRPAVAASREVAVEPDSSLSAVVVTATRTQEAAFDVPAAIDAVAIDPAAMQSLGVNLQDVLRLVPGLLVRNRQNYAQDEQVSIRGFGARSTFGVRGVRLYTDGIPASMPDGAGQISHFNLDSAERIEVLRGPFSALYGNASAGVVQLFTADGTDPPEWRLGLAGGNAGNARTSINWRDVFGAFDSNVDLTRFRSDGEREHSSAERSSGNAKLRWRSADGATLTLLANTVAIPEAQDPLGLSREEFAADPRQATSAASIFDTRKSVHQTQGGAVWEQVLDEHQDVRVLAYAGQRAVVQFLAIPVAPQTNPRSGGGVIDLDGSYRGTDARWSWRGTRMEFSLGASFEDFDQQRRGYENFLGEELGVRGVLRRDETNRVHSFDQYAQLRWDPVPAWSLLAGARHSAVAFRVDDRYINSGNPDDSGRQDYSATTPVAGLLFRASTSAHLYANWGQGFETPTFAELGYRSDGNGLNLELRPARTHSAEIGAKFRYGARFESNLAAFRADTADEIAVATNLGGRSSYRNVARARRQGVEASLLAGFDEQWSLQLSATWLDARFRTPFLACAGMPCSDPAVPVAPGTRIPGVPRFNLRAQLVHGGELGWRVRTRFEHVGDVPVNDVGTQAAGAYEVIGLDLGYGLARPTGTLRAFLDLDNLLDRSYAGSVIVNDGNGRYYEPGAGRSVTLGLQWRWAGR